jgi:adenine C2-methylase RlmN of 23S rRNA A2503 and tRNA A37
MEGGLTAIVRTSKGAEISAACGQLQAKELLQSFDSIEEIN